MNCFTMTKEDYSALTWLCSIKNFNGRLGMRFLENFSNPAQIFSVSDERLKTMLPAGAYNAFIKARSESAPYHAQDAMKLHNAKFISYYDSEYPEHLKSIPDAPLGLFVRGRLPSDAAPSVAIIGARNCSEYGRHIAAELGAYLGSVGIQVISGMAYGIDGISQNAALNSGGTSYGVLGSGVDVCYPPSNKSLYESLIVNGGIISTYGMGEPAIAANFPPRNRIVSGLSDAVVVIEARQKSGTIITVDMALEQGREVYAVPGRITDRLSDGCNGLIGQGANIYLSPEIFVSELMEHLENNISFEHKKHLHRTFEGQEHTALNLDENQSSVYSVLSITPMSVEEICERLNSSPYNNAKPTYASDTPANSSFNSADSSDNSPTYSYSQVSMILTQLMLDNHVKQVSQGSFAKIL